MTISFLQGQQNYNSSTTTLTFSFNSTKGSAFVVYAAVQNATSLSTIADSLGNTYNQVYLNVTNASSYITSLYYVYNSIGGQNTITLTPAAANWGMLGAVQEFYGVATVSPLDTNNHASITAWANTQNGPAVTTTNQNDVIVAGFLNTVADTLSLGSGYSHLTSTPIANSQVLALESQIVQSTGTYTPTMGTTATGFAGDAVTLVLKAQLGKSFQPNSLRPHAFSPGLAR